MYYFNAEYCLCLCRKFSCKSNDYSFNIRPLLFPSYSFWICFYLFIITLTYIPVASLACVSALRVFCYWFINIMILFIKVNNMFLKPFKFNVKICLRSRYRYYLYLERKQILTVIVSSRYWDCNAILLMDSVVYSQMNSLFSGKHRIPLKILIGPAKQAFLYFYIT